MLADAPLVVDVDAQHPGVRDFALHAQFTSMTRTVALCGPSGAGKSTLLALLAGLMRPRRGRIVVDGAVWFDSDERVDVDVAARRIGLVSQRLALFPHLTARANVGYGVTDKARRDAMAQHWLERLRVAHVSDRRPDTLSGGEAQRVALARAFAHAPRLLLLDEPFSALDAPLRKALRDDLLALVAERNLPLVFVTHDRDEAIAVGGTVVAVENGRVVNVALAGQGTNP